MPKLGMCFSWTAHPNKENSKLLGPAGEWVAWIPEFDNVHMNLSYKGIMYPWNEHLFSSVHSHRVVKKKKKKSITQRLRPNFFLNTSLIQHQIWALRGDMGQAGQISRLTDWLVRSGFTSQVRLALTGGRLGGHMGLWVMVAPVTCLIQDDVPRQVCTVSEG